MNRTERSIDRDELLAQLGWVRELARGLVQDPSTADDLVQEAWVAATTRPPSGATASRLSGRELNAWLSTVVRNLARKSIRTRRRRSAREEFAARPETGEDPSEVVARVALHQELAGRVLQLAEPYRSAILLRYFDGLASTEVAQLLGISHDAARKRVSRGLALLRDELDAAHNNDRAAWALVLVPLSSRPTLAVGTSSSSVTLGSSAGLLLAMKVAAAVAVLVSVFLVVRWSVVQTPDGVPTSRATAREEASAPPLAPPVEIGDTSRARVVLSDDTQVAIDVRDESGDTLGGLDVLALAHGALVAHTTTDVGGHATLSREPVFDELLVASPEHFPSRHAVATSSTNVALTVPNGGAVAGQMRGQNKRPGFELVLEDDAVFDLFVGLDAAALAAAHLVENGPSRRSLLVDEEGRFELSGLPTDWSGALSMPMGWQFAANTSGGDLLSSSTLHLLEPTRDLVLDVAGPHILRGRVVDASSGLGIAKARIQVLESDALLRLAHDNSCETDTQGHFVIPVAGPAQRSVALEVRACSGRVFDRQSLFLADAVLSDGELVINVDVGRTVAITVQDLDGAPLLGATARLPNVLGSGPSEPTDAAGRTSLSGVLANSGPLLIEATHFASSPCEVPAEDELVVRLAPAAALTVALASDGRVETRNLAVEVVWDDADGATGRYEFGEDGLCVVEPLPESGALTVCLVDVLGGRGDSRTVDTWTAPIEQRIEFAVPARLVSIAGRVVDDVGRTLPRTNVAVETESGSFAMETDARGAFQLPPVFATGATARLEITRPGRVSFVCEELVLDSRLAPFDVVLERGHTLSVDVVDSLGTPISKIYLLATFEDGSGALADEIGAGHFEFHSLKSRAGTVNTELGGRTFSLAIGPHESAAVLVVPAIGTLVATFAEVRQNTYTCLLIESIEPAGTLERIYVPRGFEAGAPLEVQLPEGRYSIGAERRTLGAHVKVETLVAPRELVITAGATLDFEVL